jgi:hypothetical protein
MSWYLAAFNIFGTIMDGNHIANPALPASTAPVKGGVKSGHRAAQKSTSMAMHN